MADDKDWISDEDIKKHLKKAKEENEIEKQLEEERLDQILGGMKEKEDEASDSAQGEISYQKLNLEEFVTGSSGHDKMPRGFEAYQDVPIEIRAVYGSKQILLGEIIDIQKGDVIKIDKTPGELLEVVVGEQVVARAEPTVVEDEWFGITINEIIPPRERVPKKTNKG